MADGVEELYRYDPRNRLTQLSRGGVVTPFRYDNGGNLLADDKALYSYDAFNRTTKVETIDGNVQINRYDAEGLRHELEENGRLVQFIFNNNREVVAEQDENKWTLYIRASSLLASSTDHARTYYHYASDEMGSTTHIVDNEGAVQNRYVYDAWGNVTEQTENVPNRFKFNGQQLDPISQQYYLRARFYNPVIARFTQEDTYRGDGLNLYAYCANNPVVYEDPTGHNPNCVKDAAARYMAEGMSKEDAYRRAYAEHADMKLADTSNLSPQERYQLEQRQNRINQPNSPQANAPTLTPGMSYEQARAAGLTSAQAFAYSHGKNPLVAPEGVGPYSDVRGHHILAQSGFTGAPGYNPKTAACINEGYMASEGIIHRGENSVTSAQRALFDSLAESGRNNTLSEHANVAREALIAGGATPAQADRYVEYAIVDMYAQGITSPTRIPWN